MSYCAKHTQKHGNINTYTHTQTLTITLYLHFAKTQLLLQRLNIESLYCMQQPEEAQRIMHISLKGDLTKPISSGLVSRTLSCQFPTYKLCSNDSVKTALEDS